MHVEIMQTLAKKLIDDAQLCGLIAAAVSLHAGLKYN